MLLRRTLLAASSLLALPYAAWAVPSVGQAAPDFEALAGQPLTAASTAPYGCSVKYKS